MAAHNLVIDIGNTNVVLGVFESDTLIQQWRINTQKKITQDEVTLTLKGLLSKPKDSPFAIQNIAVGSVVPNIHYSWFKGLETFFNTTPLDIHSSNCTFFKIEYDYPEQIGADRLCNILGCQAIGLPEAIVVDFGTATTFDVYSKNTYWGGVICPGIQSSMMALISQASKLSEIELYWNDSILGKKTDDALRNGVLYGTLGQIDFIISKLINEMSMKNPVILATGGMASLIGSRSKYIQRTEKNITLIGLNYFIKKSMEKK